MGKQQDQDRYDSILDAATLEERSIAELKRSNDLFEQRIEMDRESGRSSHRTMPDGEYALGSTFRHSGSDTRELLKALAPSTEVLQQTERACADLGYTGERKAANTMLPLFVRSALKAAQPGPEQFAAQQRMAAASTIEKADMGGVVNTSGGYAVPDIVGNEVLKIMRDASVIWPKCRVLPMTSDTLSFPDEATAVTTNWARTDGTTLTAGEPVFGVKTLTAWKLVGRATFSQELLDDSNVAIIPFLQSCFAERMGNEMDLQCIEGTSPFTGVATATSVNDGVVTTNGTLGQTLTYASATNTYASLVRIFTKAAQGSVINGGTWVCGPSVYAKILGLVDNNGQPIVRLGTVEGQPNNTLFGRPIIVSSALAQVTLGAGTNSVGGLYYGDMRGILVGLRRGMIFETTNFVNWSKFQVDGRMVMRTGVVLGVPTAWTRNLGIAV